VKALPLLGILLSSILLSGCLGGGGAATDNSAPSASMVPSDAMRVGDKVTITLAGVPQGEDYVHEFQIGDSGDINVPNLTQNFHAVGIRPAELASEIATAYRNSRIYTNPNVTVIPEDRFVNVSGDVRAPLRVLYTPDLTLLGVISAAGGFDEYADKHKVRIVRGTQLIVVDAQKATNTPGGDVLVYPGDQITVPRTIF
jgi:protein involved in polysaccharide export with SLBB domain